MRKAILPLLLGMMLSHGVSAQLVNDKISVTKVVHQEKSMYRNILVGEGTGQRCLTFGFHASVQSCIEKSGSRHLVFGYTRALLAALYINPEPKRVLVIGMGGGIFPMALREVFPRLHIDTVELDPAVIHVAETYFNYKQDDKNRAFADDGRMFVRKKLRAGETYDLVVLDAFEKEFIPEHMVTKEFMTQVKGILSPNGVLAANTFNNRAFSVYESATYQSVFGELLKVDARENRVLLARRGEFPSAEVLRSNALAFDDRLAQFSVNSKDVLAALAQVPRVTDPSVRVLTDQFSPSNLLMKQ